MAARDFRDMIRWSLSSWLTISSSIINFKLQIKDVAYVALSYHIMSPVVGFQKYDMIKPFVVFFL